MKNLSSLTLFLCTLFPVFLFAQTQTLIRGTITIEGQPAQMVSVSLKNTSVHTLTDVKGNYELINVDPGSYQLNMVATGFPEQNVQVLIHSGEELKVDFDFKDNYAQSLDEVSVTDSKDQLMRKESTQVAKMPLKNLENPQVYNVVPKELMKQQLVTDLGSALKNIPGAGVPLLLNQNRVTILSRGFTVQPKIRNGVTSFVQTSIDPVNIERIEAIKGPSATLFGSSVVSYGGLMNRVTKKPYNGFGGEVSYTGGSWDLNRLTIDLNTPINTSKTALFRLNAAGSTENSFQDAGYMKSFALAPSFSYQINDRISLLVDLEYGKNEGTSPVRFDPYTNNIPSQNIADMDMPYNRSFVNNNMPYYSESANLFAQMNYRISDHWNSQTIVSRTNSTFDGYTHTLQGRSATTLRPQITVGKYGYYSTDIQQNFTGDFKIGDFRNRLLIGLDYYNYHSTRNTAPVNTGTVDFTQPLTDYYSTYNPSYVDSAAAHAKYTNQNGTEHTYSAYVSDVLNLTDGLLAMLSLRIDRFENKGTYNIATGKTSGAYGQTALSPKLGLVYQIVKDQLALFGNYMNGFSNQPGEDINGTPFKPEHANQLEGGIKTDLFDHKLSGSVSYYDIRVDDIVRTDPDHIDYSIQDGNQKSKGLELDLTARPVNGWNIIAGYAYNDSYYTRMDAEHDGLRPEGSGPAHLVNFWTSYQLNRGKLHGLGLGVGGNYGSSSFQTNTASAKVIIPSYTVIDASVFYEQPRFIISFKVNNLTNERYWSYRLTPQKPANVLGSLTLKF